MIRSIEYADLSAIREINAQVLGYDIPLEQTKIQFERCSETNGHTILVFEDDETGQVSGYIHAQVYESLYSDTGLNILGLAVLPGHQGQGIGASLLKAVEQIAQKEGYHFIRLNSAESRLQAHLFYEKNGYHSDKMQKRFIKHI
ncbi:TPA: GNAT family N-acetyltransferase [Streptococcus suis]|uniref:Acetyltransferase (GNAT) family protein n=1 Tax=Streptococcus suis TaxID=1307 RepID=A0A0Z8D7F0_STRSU|nr:GNAT family N-acetyltransferase [Streptococcus suis]MDW8766308.1 GNAT family N-acetyltransferase [Streptococcus suis]NQH39798.1 GNAT family N-acetyltransferase [Streptococcus suis]NQH77945.1 GNAT family N-acetyltransferase [Streptococcus suis]NQR95983.1 GNAT family N-acetyltransferase [Streptococcus suis]CYU38509.1 acetyltransferase (GNAT) family protein [Streptococcus suis]